jgi:hypothetical protein
MNLLAGLATDSDSASPLSPLAFVLILAGLFALWVYLIRRFYPPRKP